MLWLADGEGNEEAETNMQEVDKNLDQMSAMMAGLNSMAQVCISLKSPRICN